MPISSFRAAQHERNGFLETLQHQSVPAGNQSEGADMTDAQMLQKLLAVYEAMVESGSPGNFSLLKLKEVIAELRRRIELVIRHE